MSQYQEDREGRYLYCIVNSGDEPSFGNIGIDDNRVYTILYKDIAAVVHSCLPLPYETKDTETGVDWFLTHNYVIDQATKGSGTVLPFSFDCLIRGNDDTVKDWLERGYEKLKRELERVRDREEYSVQIFVDPNKLTEKIVNSDKELKELKENIEKMPKGVAYLFQRKFELQVNNVISTEIFNVAQEFSSIIKNHVEEMIVEKKTSNLPEKYKDKKPVLALSCLVHKARVEKLGEVLDEINKRDGIAVRFTGPWAPFSFVQLREM